MPEKKGGKKTKPIEIAATPRLRGYLQDLVDLEGFGNSVAEVARNFIWLEVNRLIEAERLKQRDD